MIPLRANSLNTSVAGFSAQDFLTKPEVPSLCVSRKWQSVTYLPFSSHSYDYDESPFEIATGTPYTYALLGFFVESSPSNSFEWEIYLHKEFVSVDGNFQPPGQTPSHSDVNGISAVRDVLGSNLPIGDGPKAFRETTKMIQERAPMDMSSITSGFSTALEVGSALLSLF
jgi:hypothetical protein